MADPNVTAAPALHEDGAKILNGTTPESQLAENTASDPTPPKPLAGVEGVSDHGPDPLSVLGMVKGDNPPPASIDQKGNNEGHTAENKARDRGFERNSENDSDGEIASRNVLNDQTSDPGSTLKQDAHVLEQIKTLQRQLLELERQARPKLSAEALAEEWGRTMEVEGPRREFGYWKKEKRRRKAALLVETASYAEGRKWLHKVDDEASRKMAEDLDYSTKLLRYRREWERKHMLDRHVLQNKHPGGMDSDEPSDEVGNSSGSFDSDEEEEMYAIRRRQIRRTFDFDSNVLDLDFNKQRKRRARKRAREHRLREEREQLEHERLVEPIHPDKIETAVPLEVVETPTVPSADGKLTRVEWAQFKTLLLQPEEFSSAIYVLIGEPIIEFDDHDDVYSYLRSRARLQVPKADKVQDTKITVKQEAGTGDSPLPERLRIHSRHIIQILTQIHGSDLSEYGARPPLVLIRPFKVLIHYDQALRDWYRELETKFIDKEPLGGSVPASAAEDISTTQSGETNKTGPATDREGGALPEPQQEGEIQNNHAEQEEKDPKDDTTSSIAFKHLKVLLDFMDTDMSRKFSYLSSPACQKVVFSDLWHLFRPGDHVIGNDGKQAYRVLSVQSVGHRVIDPFRKWFNRSSGKEDSDKESAEETDITIKCVYLDFDGMELGPVASVFRIERFDREKAVTALPIYPLRFHRSVKWDPKFADGRNENPSAPGDRLWKYLVERGKMFLKVSTVSLAAVQPMYYAGPALETMDEIESQVVVDFEAAFAIEEHIDKGWRPRLDTLIGTTPEETKKKRCDAECCLKEHVHDDSYVEQKRNEEFMGRLLPKSEEEMPSVLILPRPSFTRLDDDLVIMSHRVFGFVLRTRKWGKPLSLIIPAC
jgi:hypothetical protein